MKKIMKKSAFFVAIAMAFSLSLGGCLIIDDGPDHRPPSSHHNSDRPGEHGPRHDNGGPGHNNGGPNHNNPEAHGHKR